MFKLLKVIKTNRLLTSLSLSFNRLLEEQPFDLESKDFQLSKANMNIVSCFKDFIKYNIYLTHLNFERCGLIEPAIKYLAGLLRKSSALRAVHFGNNEGLSQNVVDWIRERINARPEE